MMEIESQFVRLICGLMANIAVEEDLAEEHENPETRSKKAEFVEERICKVFVGCPKKFINVNISYIYML